MRASDKVCTGVPLSKVEAYLKKHTNSMERTRPHELDSDTRNRVYMDLDGHAQCETQEDFDDLVSACGIALKMEFGEEGALTSACQFGYVDSDKNTFNKLSFNFVVRNLHGSRAAIERWVTTVGLQRARNALEGLCPVVLKDDPQAQTLKTVLDIDTGIYNPKGRKMRMLWSNKDGEKRPKVLMNADQASVLDTLITYISEDSVALPEPEPPRVAAPAPILARAGAGVAAGVAAAAAPAEEAEMSEHAALLCRILSGLAPTRGTTYAEWVRIGMVLKNEEVPCSVWDEWSATRSGYTPGACESKWATFPRTPLTQGTLWKMLKEDNIEAFRALQHERTDFRALLKEVNHAACAQFFYNSKPDSYAYSPILGWFQLLPTGAWQQTADVPSGLKTDLWKTLRSACVEHMGNLDVAKEADKASMKMCQKFLVNCGSASFVEGIAKFLPTNYEDLTLADRMDETRNLFAFRDKVVELDTGVVRDIRASDYVCLTTGYDYPKSKNPEMRERITQLFNSFWEDSTMANWSLDLIAKQLHGTKNAEEVYVSTGTGRNGKGLQAELIKRALGGYFQSCEHNLITKKSDKKDSPNPALFKAKGKRMLQVQEPEADDKLQVGTIKELRGGDVVTARDLYTRGCGVSYVPQFAVWIQCNTVPKLNKIDRAIGLSLVIIPFPLQFVENPAKENERKINSSLKGEMAKDTAWRDEFILMLIERAVALRDKKLVKPQLVVEASKEYMASNDPVGTWLEDRYVFRGLDVRDKRFKISTAALLKRFLADTDTSHHDMSAERFKDLMTTINEVGFKREKHAFDGVQWENDGTGMTARLAAGSYFCGIRPRQHPDLVLSEHEDERAAVFEHASAPSDAAESEDAAEPAPPKKKKVRRSKKDEFDADF